MYNMINTDIICPNCRQGCMIREEPKVIKSNTDTYAYLCPICGFVHTTRSDGDMEEWIKSLDKPIEEKTIVKSSNSMVRETDIKCPICGAFIFCDESMILTSNPPQHRYYCPECGEFSHSAFSDGDLLDYIKRNFVMSEKDCEFCICHEKGDVLYELVNWECGFVFDKIRNIKYCPLCGATLKGADDENLSADY